MLLLENRSFVSHIFLFHFFFALHPRSPSSLLSHVFSFSHLLSNTHSLTTVTPILMFTCAYHISSYLFLFIPPLSPVWRLLYLLISLSVYHPSLPCMASSLSPHISFCESPLSPLYGVFPISSYLFLFIPPLSPVWRLPYLLISLSVYPPSLPCMASSLSPHISFCISPLSPVWRLPYLLISLSAYPPSPLYGVFPISSYLFLYIPPLPCMASSLSPHISFCLSPVSPVWRLPYLLISLSVYPPSPLYGVFPISSYLFLYIPPLPCMASSLSPHISSCISPLSPVWRLPYLLISLPVYPLSPLYGLFPISHGHAYTTYIFRRLHWKVVSTLKVLPLENSAMQRSLTLTLVF